MGFHVDQDTKQNCTISVGGLDAEFAIEGKGKYIQVRRIGTLNLDDRELPAVLYNSDSMSLVLRVQLLKSLLSGKDPTADTNRLVEIINWLDGPDMMQNIIDTAQELERKEIYKASTKTTNLPVGEAITEARKQLKIKD